MHEEVRTYLEELLANQAYPVDTWIHLQSCPKCSRKLEAFRRVSGVLARDHCEAPEPDPFFYARVQARIESMRFASPWHVFWDTGVAKRLVLTCLACTGLLAVYLFSISPEEYAVPPEYRAADLTGPEFTNREAQRNAVLVNFVADSTPIDEPNR